MGSVVRRGPGTWQLFFEVPRREDAPHERRRRSVLFRGTERAARKELARLELEAEAGRLVAGRLTCGALFDRYLKEHVALHQVPQDAAHLPLRPGRDGDLARVGRRAARPAGGPPGAGARHHLTALRARLRDEGRAPATVGLDLRAIKAASTGGPPWAWWGAPPPPAFSVAT